MVIACGVCWLKLHNQLEMQYGGLQSDFDNVRAQLDEELEGAAALKTQLQKSQTEYQTLKSKYDKDVSARADELDELRSAPFWVCSLPDSDSVLNSSRYLKTCDLTLI